MQIKTKEFFFLLAWIAIVSFGTLVLGADPIVEKCFYLATAVICELWIVFRLPGARFLWIFPENAANSKYREFRILSFILLWFLMLAVPRGFDLFAYYLFALCIERVIFCTSLSKKKKIQILQKIFPPYARYGALSIVIAVAGFLLLALLCFRIGMVIARWIV